jgi:hypothetical protein
MSGDLDVNAAAQAAFNEWWHMNEGEARLHFMEKMMRDFPNNILIKRDSEAFYSIYVVLRY